MSEFKSWEDMSELEQLSCEFWDFYKSAYGFRPRGIDTSNWTVEQYKEEFQTLNRICETNELARKQEQEQATKRLEIRIANLIQSGAKDRSMAIRWIDESESTDGDMDYLCYLLGVEYGYFKNDQ